MAKAHAPKLKNYRVEDVHKILKIRKNLKYFREVYFPALLYGCLLLLLLFRKKDDGPFSDSANMPSIIAPLLIYSLYLAIILIIIISAKTIAKKILKPPPFYIFAYIFSIFFYNARVFDTSDIPRSLVGLTLPLLILIILSNNATNGIQSLIYRKSLTFCFAVFSGVNVALLASGFGFHGFRFSGITFHPNQLGLVACLACVFFIANTFSSKHLVIRIISAGFLLASGVLLVASGSRGALLATVTGAIFYLAVERKLLPLIVVLAIGLLTLSILTIISPENLSFAQSRITDSGDNRSDVWLQMFSAFIESPLIGMGPDAMGSESSILKALAVGGIICGLPVIWMTIKIIKIPIYYFFDSRKIKDDSVYYSLIVCIFVASMLDGYLFEKLGFTSLLLLMTLSFIIEPTKANKKLRNQQNKSLRASQLSPVQP